MPGLADLELELSLLELEATQLAAELDGGFAIAGRKYRRPFPHELRARVRFAELDRIISDTASLAARKADTVRAALLDALTELPVDTTAGEALRQLRALADPLSGTALPGLKRVVDEVARELTADLTRAAKLAGDQVLDEALAQGIPARILPAEVPLGDAATRELLRAAAQQVANAPVSRLLNVALEAGHAASLRPDATGADVIFEALDAAETASTKATEDLARQAATTAHGAGRAAGGRAAPEPREVYASELLDGATCRPCATVDGRRYLTLSAALEDYPGAGGFVFCDGGRRCRGTLVYVWRDEATPTTDEPGDGPAGPRRPPPQGPSDPPEPPVRPLPPDDRAFPLPKRAPAPSAPNPPATPPAADPATVPADPDLAQLGDARLEAELRAVAGAGDQARAVQLADELDRRAALGSEWRDPDAEAWDIGPALTAEEDAAQAARIAAAMEDAAPELNLSLGTPAAGSGVRRIERVREEYLAEQYRRMMEAEHAAGIRADRAAEFAAKYGDTPGAYEDVIWHGPARTAYYYASEELRRHWATHPRLTFAEFAEAAGIRDAKTVARARAARAAREDAARRAEESGTGRDLERKRARDAERRRNRDNSVGAQLERERRRMAREQARAAKADEAIRRAGGTIDPPAQ